MHMTIVSVMFIVLAPFLLLSRLEHYRGYRWKDFNFKAVILDMTVLFVVLMIISFFLSGDDSSTLDDVDPQDGGRWIH